MQYVGQANQCNFALPTFQRLEKSFFDKLSDLNMSLEILILDVLSFPKGISIFSALVASSVGVKPKKLLIHTVLDHTVHYMYVSRQSGQHLRKEVTAETSTLLPKVT